MGSYDLKRLEVAVQYIRRMAEGRNPVTNRPAPDNDVLTNINVNRCLKFVEEFLTDVHKAGGQVGALPRKSAPRPSLAETFPYEILSEFHYEQDQQISYLLNQIGRPLPEDQKMPVAATVITNWMRENGYLEKRMMQDIGKENSVPTEKGMQLGLYSEKAGMGQNMYYRVYYNEKAQRFIVDNFRRILTEYEEIRARGRKTAKKPAADKAEQTKSADSVFISSGVTGSGETRSGETRSGVTGSREKGSIVTGSGVTGSGVTGTGRAGRGGQSRPGTRTNDRSGQRRQGGDDPDLASLLSNISGGDLYDAQDDGFSQFETMGDGWQAADEDLPW